MTGLTELLALNETRFSDIRVVAETGSTNADLLDEGRAGAPEGSVLLTDHQTAGRGRQARNWHDEPGNALLVSLLLRPSRELAPLTPLLSGVAAVEALLALLEQESGGTGSSPGSPLEAQQPAVGLKWPNDVLSPLLDERKLAGILAESTTSGSSRSATADLDDDLVVVVGMGLNLRWGSPPPADISSKAATVGELAGRPVDREEVLGLYLRWFEHWLRIIESEGTAPLLDRYRRRCLTIGREVRFTTAKADYDGTVVDVSDAGTLLLDTGSDGIVELHAGDAHHVPR